jgi:hypothetical protein
MYLQFMSTGDKHFSHLRTHFIWKIAAALLVVRPRRRRRKFQTQGEMAAERGQLRDTVVQLVQASAAQILTQSFNHAKEGPIFL